MIGIEVKSGTATKTPAQRAFDSNVSKNNPATGIVKNSEIIIRKTLEIRRQK